MNQDEVKALRAYLAQRKALIERSLSEYLPGEERYPETIFRAVRYSVHAGGKLLRPILCLAAGEAVGGHGGGLLPVACALWKPDPDLETGAAAWILAGGAHHTAFSQAVTAEMLEDFADMAGIEFLLIDGATDLRRFKQEMRWNQAYWRLAAGV